MPELFHSRLPAHRFPTGAVTQGTEIFFRICPPRALNCYGARLCVRDAAGDGAVAGHGMFWAGMENDDREWWDCRFTPEHPSLIQYWFELDTPDGAVYLIRTADGSAVMSRRRSDDVWQLTCYSRDFNTPEWLAGGIMYQIFPDRFARSGVHKSDVPGDREMHDEWSGLPRWKPDHDGEIRNNDYFGGDLRGIEQRLDRLAELGVTCLYLNPIFEAHSNHRYNTADYTSIDPLLGTREDFLSLLRTASSLGIRVLLDGVFSHTGADSVYFNQNGRYPGEGAAQSQSSPYFSWFKFTKWPESYASWWGIRSLPEVEETDPGFIDFICGENGIARTCVREGAGGWRLDVADELPDEFLDSLRIAVKKEDPAAIIIGEVWEDASNKASYGHHRRYLLGQQLDSVMNYPFRSAIIQFMNGGNGADFMNAICDITENYPPQATRLLMNMLGTHDTPRILTILGGILPEGHTRNWQAEQVLSPEQRTRAIMLLKSAAAIQYTLPGVPVIYYGDEAGMEGCGDPFNRGCYPWGGEDGKLMAWYRRLGQLRRACPVLAEGEFLPLAHRKHAVVYERIGNGSLLCAVNAGVQPEEILLPERWHGCTVIMGGGRISGDLLILPPADCAFVWLPAD